jgi:alpha-amylase/alpha-mannosidase (GH57 family)
MSLKAFCVHGHFYQPPREDPFTGIIPIEIGAAPYSNWNERIVDDCYRPNAEEGNFGSLSFNIGPTLSEWLQINHPAVLKRVIDDDRYNFDHLGAGNAMAQPYHHTILPLATSQDKSTQIRWGIEAFKKCYGRNPRGMWLPETAVDVETLEIMAANGIEFTILAPWQSVFPTLDPGLPYKVKLEGNRYLTVFFYDRELSSNISFNPGITANADEFVQKYLAGKFSTAGKDRMVLVASDGELYGHHQQFRYKFLKQLFHQSLQKAGIKSAFPEDWLKYQPAVESTEIIEKTSWSCMHELKRWSGVCDCTPHPEWKKPLRYALDETAKILDGIFLDETASISQNPWTLRDLAIHARELNFNLQSEVTELGGKMLKQPEVTRLNLLLRSQFERQRMFASCAWFFEDFDRIEPQNAVKYAANAVYLTEKATGQEISKGLLSAFESVKSWRNGLSAGKVFQDFKERVSAI